MLDVAGDGFVLSPLSLVAGVHVCIYTGIGILEAYSKLDENSAQARTRRMFEMMMFACLASGVLVESFTTLLFLVAGA